MKLSIIVAAIMAFHDTSAFTTYINSRRSSTALFQIDPSRIKKAGAGIATKPPGGNCSFDPNENGKLQGTGNCDERVVKGSSYGAAAAAPSGGGGGGAPTKAPTSNLTSLINSKSQY